jgi:hypothetical protein
MGIGTTAEVQSDLLNCPAIKWKKSAHTMSVNSDVFVTHPLSRNVHILTCDYLVHRAPCVILPAAGEIRFNETEVKLRDEFAFQSARFVGGAFCVDVKINGHTFQLVVHTGASAPISLGKRAGVTMHACTTDQTRMVAQTGVHGERICSDVISASVELGGTTFDSVKIYVNESDVEGADGMIGMGVLRAVDIFIDRSQIGFRPNKLPTKAPLDVSGHCENRLPACTNK